MSKSFAFVDLFCGIGAFHQALSNIGGKCAYACDIDAYCRRTYERNYGIVPDGDITKVDVKDIPPHDVLCGGFPCQAFSIAGNKQGFADPTRGTLFFDILRIIEYHKPKYVLLENVHNLVYHDHGNTWRVIHDSLIRAGYNVPDQPVIFSPHYIGIPQHRKRIFIMCVRKDLGTLPQFCFNLENIPPCSIDDILLDDAEIEDIESYRLTPEQIEWIDNWNEFIQAMAYDKLPSHPIWTDSFCPVSENFRTIENKLSSAYVRLMMHKNSALWEKNKEFIARWLPKAQKNKLFYGSKAKFEWQAGDCDNPNVWDNIMQIRQSGLRVRPATYFPALVAITQTSIVGKRKRFLTPRECARLQSFPDTFQYDEKQSQAYKQLGNSINVALAELFARYLLGDEEVRRKYSYTEQFEKNDYNLFNTNH